MRRITFLPLFILAAFALSCAKSANTNVAANNTATTRPKATPVVHQDDGHDAPRISLAEAKKHFDEKTAVFIDTHPPNQFEIEHIQGAINIQPNTIKQSLDKIPRGKKIIVYCS
jgi:predicted sulfurtransferase